MPLYTYQWVSSEWMIRVVHPINNPGDGLLVMLPQRLIGFFTRDHLGGWEISSVVRAWDMQRLPNVVKALRK